MAHGIRSSIADWTFISGFFVKNPLVAVDIRGENSLNCLLPGFCARAEGCARSIYG